MKKTLLASLALLGSASLWAQSQQTISYVCEGNVRASISYSFNAETGFPTQARVNVKRKNFTVQYDDGHSDHVGSFFQNRQGYKLNAPALTMNDLKNTDGIQIFDRNDQILAQDCNVSSASVAVEPLPQDSAVRYQCQNGQSLRVNYAFNREGLPVSALVQYKKLKLKLPIDLNRSDLTASVFQGRGYTLEAGALDRNNYRESGGVMLQNAQSQILAKDCEPEG